MPSIASTWQLVAYAIQNQSEGKRLDLAAVAVLKDLCNELAETLEADDANFDRDRFLEIAWPAEPAAPAPSSPAPKRSGIDTSSWGASSLPWLAVTEDSICELAEGLDEATAVARVRGFSASISQPAALFQGHLLVGTYHGYANVELTDRGFHDYCARAAAWTDARKVRA